MKKILSILLLTVVHLYATPQFAREYNVKCSACHSAVPVLNETGRDFLRNGLRFSFNEKTTLQKLTEDRNTTYIPAAILLGVKYNSVRSDVKVAVKPFIAGTLTSEDSLFLTFGKSKNIYYQKNLHKQNHVIRAGFLSVYTQLSSINKIFSGTGTTCNNDDCTNIFKTPLQKASIKSLKGVEYSYKRSNSIFLLSLGVTQDNTKRKTCVDKYDLDYANRAQIAASFKHSFYGYNIGVIYGKIKNSELTDYSIVSFLDKDFEIFSTHFAYVYKKDKDFNYQGVEGMVSYRYDDTAFIKMTGSYDNDDLYNNSSTTLGFEKIFNHLLFSSYIGYRYNQNIEETTFQSTLSLYF
jgi:hypothetical protein